MANCTSTGTESEYAVVGELMHPRWWNECGQALNEHQRLKNEVRCPITERRTKLMHDAAIGRERETFVREWRTSDVAAKVFQSRRLSRLDLDCSVQTETVQLRTQLLDHHRSPRDRDSRYAKTLDPRTRLRAKRRTSLNRCCAEEREEALARGGRSGIQLALLSHQSPTATEAQYP